MFTSLKSIIVYCIPLSSIVGFCKYLFCTLLCVRSSFAIISMGKREMDAMPCLSSWCLVIYVWLFLTMPRVCLQFVIVVFPDHTHYFCILKYI